MDIIYLMGLKGKAFPLFDFSLKIKANRVANLNPNVVAGLLLITSPSAHIICVCR